MYPTNWHREKLRFALPELVAPVATGARIPKVMTLTTLADSASRWKPRQIQFPKKVGSWSYHLTEAQILNVAPSAITAFLMGFIEDFNNLDWPSFRARFRDDATIFFPQQYQVRRAAGRTETDAAWQAVFGSIRAASGKTAPPYMQLQPQEIVVQELVGAAVATFILQSGPAGTVGRRSLVIVETADGWKIAHLHGSTAFTTVDR